MDRITAGILAATAGVALGAATPAFLRAAGVEIPVVASPSAAPLALPRRPPELLAHDGLPDMPFDGDDDDVPMFSDPSPPAPGILRDASDPWSQVGLARAPVVLHEHPGGAAKIVGEIGAGELVTIVRFAGEWALVVHAGSGALVSGWAKRSEIAVR